MTIKKTSAIDRFLGIIEKVGNALPHPATLFAGFALLVVLLSWVVAQFGVSVVHPGTGETVTTFNLLSAEGLHMILTKMVVNFTSFAPLGTVLVALLGIGIAEGSGLIGTVLRLVVLSSPKKLLTFVIVFAGVISNTASEVGYVLLVPLAAVIFLAAGRHPLAGLAVPICSWAPSTRCWRDCRRKQPALSSQVMP
jgi:aminobenzoyl-glutamate transport protein